MNFVLFLLVIAALGGAGYEHTLLQDQVYNEQQQLDGAEKRLAALQAANKQTDSSNAATAAALASLQENITALKGQIAPLEGDVAHLKLLTFAPPVIAPPPPPPDPNNLGTVTTLTGQTYTHAHLMQVHEDGIILRHDAGITEVLFGILPPALQQKFGYDPHVAARLDAAQLQKLEADRQAAENANANNAPPQ